MQVVSDDYYEPKRTSQQNYSKDSYIYRGLAE